MPEQRARQIHRDRVASTFGEEISAMLEGELSDPRIAACHVTEVILAPGGKSCRVLIAVHEGGKAEEDTLAGLIAARAYIRTEIRDRMGVRHVPELTFAIDRSERIGARMDELLGRMQKRKEKLDRKVQAKAAAAKDGTPAQGTPARGTPAQGTPAQRIPAQGIPAKSTPAKGKPTQSTPASPDAAESAH